MDIDIFYK